MQAIPEQKIYEWQLPDIQKLKREAPIYLQAYLDKNGVCVDQFQITALDAGEESACYYLLNPKASIILKFKLVGVPEEAIKLSAWHTTKAPVPDVLDQGVLTNIAGSLENIQFIALEAIADQNLQISPLGFKVIDANPTIASKIGIEMGTALARMHQSRPMDDGASTNLFQNFLLCQLKSSIDYLESKGIGAKQIAYLQSLINEPGFFENQAYIHADFGIHNALVNDMKGVQVIDPSYKPLVGDPYWDVALILFRLEVSRFMYDINPTNEEVMYQYRKFTSCYQPLVDTYLAESGTKFDTERLSAYKILALLPKMIYRENKLKKWIDSGMGDKDLHEAEIKAYSLYLTQAFRANK